MNFFIEEHKKLKVHIHKNGFSIGYSMQPLMYCSKNFSQTLKNRDCMLIGYDPLSIEDGVQYSKFSEEILNWYEKNKTIIHKDSLAGFSEDSSRSLQRLSNE